MAIVLPHGVLFRGGEERDIRKNLIENDHLDTIIGLPANIFFGTGIPTVILVLKQKRKNSDVLIVDASKGFAKDGKNNKLRAGDIKKICDTVIGRRSVPQYSRVIEKSEVRENAYNLNIPRYVDSSTPAQSWDLYASMFGGIPQIELDELNEYWQAFPNLRSALFHDDGTPYVNAKVDDLVPAIREHVDVQGFEKQFADAFANFPEFLKGALIEQVLTLNIPRQESLIGEEIFTRLESLALVDKYHAYQVLDDHWQQIAIDLEIIQTEGFEASRVVEPNLVIKKKSGKDVEVQEGWKGRIMPFALVQSAHLKEALDELRGKETLLREISSSIEETLENFSEEEREDAMAQEVLHESGGKFVNVTVAKEAKQLKAEAKRFGGFHSDSYEAKIIQVADSIAKEKILKGTIKKDTDALHLLTRKYIEGLDDEQVNARLEDKWITPFSDALDQLPSQQIDILTAKLQALVEKYHTTYAENARDIRQVESELAGMIDGLDGNSFDLKSLSELKTLLEGN